MPVGEKPPGGLACGGRGGGGDLNSVNMRHCSLFRYKTGPLPAIEVFITLER